MSKRSWIEEQCFRMCSSESVECTCRKLNNEALERSLKDVRNPHTGSSFEKFYQEEIVAQDHIEPEVTGGSNDSSED